eukprot:NODE_8382_length_360_cov_18.607717_g6634_i0.p1 GENE.NODE_8382_length_360_cov_18.607717_g6634_i0~~NODE_8382_length_360_cov_18.607717_g6634_i0.p1  ORF type:complete len:81 (+),score=13.34 NODE_8382_length_360_cov_18.607717_g6634_i0:74-316(+)
MCPTRTLNLSFFFFFFSLEKKVDQQKPKEKKNPDEFVHFMSTRNPQKKKCPFSSFYCVLAQYLGFYGASVPYIAVQSPGS